MMPCTSGAFRICSTRIGRAVKNCIALRERGEENPEREGDRKNPDDHAGPPPADLRLPAEELDERLQREGDQGRGENRDEHGCGEVEEGDHPEGCQERETRDGRSGKSCALHSNNLLFFTFPALRILWYECRKRRAGRVEGGG